MNEPVHHYCVRLRPILANAVGQTLREIFRDLPGNPGDAIRDSFLGGKLIRASLVCLVNESLGGSLEQALPRAVAVELIHGATLLHDDFVDQDRTRRNQPAAWTLAGARKAVLLGDVIFASAIEMMSELSRADGIAVSRAIARISRGALKEPVDPSELAGYLIPGAATERLYDAIIDLKTGVLFGVACELGAISARANDPMRNAFYRYGRLIGQAYQIADDVKEIRQYIVSGTVNSQKIAALTPPLLRFNGDLRPGITAVLAGELCVLQGNLLQGFAKVAESMEEEMRSRLTAASTLVSECLSNVVHADMIQQAPHDLIEMFNRT